MWSCWGCTSRAEVDSALGLPRELTHKRSPPLSSCWGCNSRAAVDAESPREFPTCVRHHCHHCWIDCSQNCHHYLIHRWINQPWGNPAGRHYHHCKSVYSVMGSTVFQLTKLLIILNIIVSACHLRLWTTLDSLSESITPYENFGVKVPPQSFQSVDSGLVWKANHHLLEPWKHLQTNHQSFRSSN